MSLPTATSTSVSAPALPHRLSSIDAYRGLVMLLMMYEVLHFSRVARALPESGFWSFLAWQQSHVPWVGCTLHDLIQPSFTFLVGVVLPFSLANRIAHGASRGKMTAHALWRALLLVLLGVWLRSINRDQINWTFEDTLTQIGLGYGFLFVLGFRPVRDQWIAFAAILVATWAAFAAWPLAGPEFDFAKVGVSGTWLEAHGLTGFAAHWQKNSNLAWAFDTWWSNLFPRAELFSYNSGGYATLSFIPTLATMILGLIAGGVIRGERAPREKIRWLAVAGVIALLGGAILGWLGICPVVKRIWTPSWVLFSGGACMIILAAFYWVIDVRQHRSWAFPLVVVGANSIAAYMIAHLVVDFSERSLLTVFGPSPFLLFGDAYKTLLLGGAVLVIEWLILYWMWRRRLFLKI